ncbi:polydiglycosylphosphate transferase PdtA [Streptomyces sanyensis]|uniref:Polydiglycosylphosphate transferase PdtA n=1 Tax=Streptomyces sanyensis TaxID=568869 RepID=A0ABP8ZWK9_9ACTN
MNDQQQPYDPYGQQPQIIGYDEYGRPVYQQPPQYDPYAQHQDPYPGHAQQAYPGYSPQDPYPGGPGYDQDPYAPGAGPHVPGTYHDPEVPAGDPYATGSGGAYPPASPGGGRIPDGGEAYPQAHGYDQGGPGYGTGGRPAAVDTTRQWGIPQQYPAPADGNRPDAPAVPEQRRNGPDGGPGEGRGEADDREYRTEQFSFIEEPDEDSEDVIDWLKFTESRSERREEAKRRGRNRLVAFAVVLALAAVGGVGYLWYAGKLPGTSAETASEAARSGPQKRDVIVVHLHSTKSERTSTALLVDNVTARHGTTVLLPNTLSVANDDGTATTLAKSVEDDGSTGTREAVGTLLGARISGTWRLDTPYLENLVELVGTIDLTTDTEVPGARKGDPPLVQKGENQTLDGRAAVAYATHLGTGEAEEKQLRRFGQVMQGVLKKMPTDPGSATLVVETLAQILDPSLDEQDLGTSLAKLAEHAKGGDYTTAVLPVQEDGTLTEKTAAGVVKDVLGGKVTAPEQGAAVRVGLRNGTGDDTSTEAARIALVNGGYSVVDGGSADAADASRVTYGDDTQKARAQEVAKTLGLPAAAVVKGEAAANADVSVVLGSDYGG